MVRLARAATGIGLPELPTRAQQAGLRLEDVPRPAGSSDGIGSTPRSAEPSGGPSDGAGRRTRGYGAVRAGVGEAC
jgi:hypothetical protein